MAASAGISNLTEIANLLGGNRTTQRVSANTGPLEQAIAQLSQQQDPAAQLTSIFQQALGAMPQLQARYSNAVGARSGGNAAVQTSLDKLLQDTVIKGQSQIAQQDLARQSAAAGAAGQLANATRNVTTQQGTNLQRAGGVLALLQGGSKLMDSPLGKKAQEGVGGFFDSLGTESVDSASLPDGGMSFAPQQDLGFDNISQGVDLGGFDFGSSFDFGGGAADGAVDAGNSDAWDYVLEFADGGLVGRDGNKPTVARAGGARRSASPSYEADQIQQSTAINRPMEELLGPQLVRPQAQAQSGSGAGVPEGTQLAMPEGGDLAKLLLSALGGPLAFGAAAGDLEMKRTGVNQTGFGLRDALTLANEAANPINKAVALLKGANALMAPPKTATQTGGSSAGAAASSGSTTVQQGGQTYYQSRGPSGFDGGAFGSQNSSPTGFGGPSFSFSDSGATSTAAASGSAESFARGGEVKGPGTGTSDSIKAKLSDGEYVIPADVVKQLGVAFFDGLKDRFHEPAYIESVEQEEPGETEDD